MISMAVSRFNILLLCMSTSRLILVSRRLGVALTIGLMSDSAYLLCNIGD